MKDLKCKCWKQNKANPGGTNGKQKGARRSPDELWIEVHDIVQEAGSKIIPKKKKCKKGKMAV